MISNSDDIISETFRFAHNAMATSFEIILYHEDEQYAQQVAWEAFKELDRLEQELSRFIENSDISRINSLATNESTRIGLAAFECLQQCAKLYDETGGTFDVTIGFLRDYWLNKNAKFRNPSGKELRLISQRTGMHHLQLDETQYSVKIRTGPICIDLGGFGKGYAVDQMAKLLLDWELDTFLIHGGTSSVLTIGAPPNTKGWPLSISNPFNNQKKLETVFLKNQAMSGSGMRKGLHIIDPRTAQPVKHKGIAWAFAPTAAISDALSTAFMIMTPDEIDTYCSKHPEIKAMIIIEQQSGETGQAQILRF